MVIVSLAVAIQPWLSSIYPGILVSKLVMMIGASGPGSSPLVADYVKHSSRGQASAYTGLMASLGVIFGMFVLFGLTNRMQYIDSYALAAAITMALALFEFYAIKDVRYQKNYTEHLPLAAKTKIIFSQIRKEVSSKIEITVCLVGSFCVRMLNFMSNTYINLWISSYYNRDYEA